LIGLKCQPMSDSVDGPRPRRACWSSSKDSQRSVNRVTTLEQREAFGRALQEALDEARMSGRGLAKTLGLSPTSVSKWLRGRTTPPPETVARAESLLSVNPGTLSRPLGYVVLDEPGRPKSSSVAQAVKSDPQLGPREQAILLTVYRELVRQYGAGRRESAEPTS